LKRLTDRGLTANIRMRGETKELYFNDPDNVRVQLQDVKYKCGVGVSEDERSDSLSWQCVFPLALTR